MEQDEIYLADLCRMLLRRWRWFAATFVVVIALTLAFLATARPQWEATAWIRIGQVGAAPAGEDGHAEPFQRVLDRLNTVPFQDAVLHDLGIAPRSPDAALYRSSFHIYPSPYAGLVKIILRGRSPEQARQLAQATFDRLKTIHDGIEAEPLRFAQDRLAQAKTQLAAAQAERTRLRDALSHGDAGAARQDLVLASVASADVDREIRELQQIVSDLTTRLSDSYSYGTSLAWPTYVPDRRASPHPVPVLGIGLLLALGLGFAAAVARDAWQRDGRADQPNRGRTALTD